MKSPKNFLLLLLTLTTVGGAALAWHQYQELRQLRAAALNPDERADLLKRIAELEKSNRTLSSQLAAAQAEKQDAGGTLANADERPEEGRGGRGRGGPGGRSPDFAPQAAALRELLAKPEVQALIDSQRKLAIEQRYSALFRNLNLSPEQASQLETLLAERGNTRQDVMAAAREQGLDPRSDPEGFRKLMTDAQNEVNNSIKALIGDNGYAQLQTYEQTMPQRNLVNELQQRLSYTNNPLTSTQAEQLVQILAATTPARTAGQANTGTADPGVGRGPGDFAGGFGGPRGGEIGAVLGGMMGGGDLGGRGAATAAPITSAAVSQAQGVLSQTQLTALQQLQQQQQAQQQLQQLLRTSLQQNPAAPPAGGTSTNPPAGGRRGGG